MLTIGTAAPEFTLPDQHGRPRRLRDLLADGPLIFNLGHGITPETPLSHVEQMVARVRKS